MKQRVITGLIFALIFLPGIVAGGIYFYALSLIISYVGTFELMNMFYKKNESLKILRYIIPFLSVIFLTIVIASLNSDTYGMYLSDGELILHTGLYSYTGNFLGLFVFAIIFMLLSILAIIIISIFTKNGGQSAIDMLISFLYGGVLVALALSLEYVKPIDDNSTVLNWGGKVFAYLYSVVALTDVFAYFTGRFFGKTKLCPTISPKKTVEGAIGGTLIGSIVGTGAAILFEVIPFESNSSIGVIILSIALTFVLSVLISIVSQFGDLFASLLKRKYEIKDYGNILPGHGGIMDRFDSVTLAGTFLFIIYLLFRILL